MSGRHLQTIVETVSGSLARTDLSQPRFGPTGLCNGSVGFRDGKSFFISAALADQTIGFEEEEDGLWRINFMDLDLGFLDDQTMKFTPISPEESHQRISPPSREN